MKQATQLPPEQKLPPPSAEFVVLSAFMEAVLRNVSRRKRNAILKDTSEILDWYEANAHIVRFRPREQDAALAKARAEGIVWWKQIRLILAGRLLDRD